MNDLALCVINTGKHYDNRLRVARTCPNASRMTYWRDLARNEAAYETVQFGLRFTAEDINQAAAEIDAYMMQHISEFESC